MLFDWCIYKTDTPIIKTNKQTNERTKLKNYYLIITL